MQQKGIFTKSQSNLEQEIHRLCEELRTVNVAHAKRMEFENILERYKKECQACKEEAECQKHCKNLADLDRKIAFAALHQAEEEISKKEKTGACFLGLENIRKELEKGTLTPSKARKEIKEICRHHLY